MIVEHSIKKLWGATKMYSRILASILAVLLWSTLCTAQLTWHGQNSGTTAILQDVYFVDAYNGWASGDGPILHTSDGGVTWVEQNTPPLTGFYVDIIFADGMNGWACGNEARIIHTSDGGNSWSIQSNPYTAAVPIMYGVYFANSDTGWVVGGDHGTFPSYINRRVILSTTNGGNTWAFQYDESYQTPLSCVQFINGTEGFAASETGNILNTSDGGTTWATRGQVSGRTFSIYFINNMTGWVCGEDLTASHYSTISRTTDGGFTWNTQSFGASEYIQDIAFIDDNTGWAVGGTIGGSGGNQHTTILYTTDAGTNWVVQNPPSTNTLLGVSFEDAVHGWTAGVDGTILTTVNPVLVEPEQLSPAKFSLDQNYPNPFNPTTTITFRIPRSSVVSLRVFNLLGQEVATLVDGNLSAGRHSRTLNAGECASGIYYYRLVSGDFSQTRIMALTK